MANITSFSSTNDSTITVDNSNYWVENANHSWSLTQADADTLRFELRSGDHWTSSSWSDPSTSQRDEISASKTYAAGTQINLSYDFMVEPGATDTANGPGKWTVLGQMHEYNVSDSPPFAVELVNGDHMAINIGTNTLKYLYIDPNPIQRGHYYSMDVQVKFDANGNGFLEVWRDGVQIVDYHGSIGTGAATYWKEGVYRSSASETMAVDYRNLHITTGSAPAPTTQTTPVITGYSPDTNLAGDGITDANHLNLAGTAAASSMVAVYDGATKLGTATANSSGAWSFGTGTLTDDSHAFTSNAMDAAGNVSAASAKVTVVVDTLAPGRPTIASFSPDSGVTGDGVTNANHVTLTGTAEAGSAVKVFDGATQIGTATANSSGAWSFGTGTLTDDSHAFTSKAMDAAGNVSETSAALTVVVDTVAPGTPIDTISNIHSVVGSSYSDSLSGGTGSDRFFGGPGNDTIDGKGGVDTAVFSGSPDNFQWQSNPDGSLTIADLRPNAPEGTDLIRNVEALEFDSGPNVSGGTSTTTYDIGNSFFWTTDTRTYDAQGRVSTIRDKSDAGPTFFTGYNLDHSNAWNAAVSTYDAQGRLGFVSIYKDVTLVTTYDAAGDKPWSQAITGYDSQGRLDYVTVVNDDHSSLYTRYSYSGNIDYSIYTYDAQNHLAQSYIHHPNGTYDIIT